MKNFFYYCYYRISSAYKVVDSSGYYIYGNIILSLSQAFFSLSILSIVLSLMGKKQSVFIISTVIIFFYVINLFLFTKKKYDQLSEDYKEEKHKKVKGHLVTLYVLFSFLFYVVTLFVLDV